MITKWAGLASGEGTILDAFYGFGLRPELVLVDKECPAAEKAKAIGLKIVVLPKEGRFDRQSGRCDEARVAYTHKLIEVLRQHGIELVVMAGFMTVLAEEMFAPENYPGRVLNTHPALLPAFKGERAWADALEAGVKVTGCTVHVATERLDDGPILGQKPVRILDDDTETTLHERIKQQERILYPQVVSAILNDKINLEAIWRDWQAKKAS